MKKSGYDNYDGIWGNEYYEEDLKKIDDWNFKQKVFSNQPALVSKEVKGQHIIPFTGQSYDKKKYELIKNAWNHKHCMICQATIDEGFSYWENAEEQILCDECYKHYKVT